MSVANANNFNSPIFDVVEYIKKLRNAGVSQEVAEIQGQEIEHVINNVLKQTEQKTKELFDSTDLANKGDISLVRSEIRESEFRIKVELIKWILGTGVTSVVILCGTMFTILKVMLHV